MRFMGEAMSINGQLQYLNPAEFNKWCQQYPNQRALVTIELLSDVPEKMRMFAYLHGPLMDCMLLAYEEAGYNQISSADLYLALKAQYATEPWYNPLTKKEEKKIIEFSDPKVPTDRLTKFINDLVYHLEQDLNWQAPNSEEYKFNKALGTTGFKQVK